MDQTRMLVSYRGSDSWAAAASIGGLLVDLGACASPGDGKAIGMRELLGSGADAVDRALASAEAALATGAVEPLAADRVVLGPVVPNPEKIICIGANYQDHLDESNFATPPYPEVFAKFPSALIAAGDSIPLTGASKEVDYEGELALVVGERCRDVSAADALGVLAGYTVANDISARDIQLRVQQWVAGKTLDGYAPLGPGLVSTSDVPDPRDLALETRLNGTVVQRASTQQMIFDIPRIVEYLSSLITLVPGDVIYTGTPGGVGIHREPPRFLEDGDVVEVEIENVGVLHNPVRAA